MLLDEETIIDRLVEKEEAEKKAFGDVESVPFDEAIPEILGISYETFHSLSAKVTAVTAEIESADPEHLMCRAMQVGMALSELQTETK